MNPSSSRHLNVLVMYHDPIVCAGLVAALRQEANFEILVHGVDNPASSSLPIDVVIADYANAMLLAEIDVRKTHGQLAEPRILALTARDREADIRRALQAGIRGYLLLGGSLHELIDAVRAVGNGARCLCPAVAERLAESLAGVTLTLRENEVLRLVAEGQSNKAIAKLLAIELGTVKSHVSAIMTKLGASSRTQAASIAVNRGLVDESGSRSEVFSSSRAPMVELRAQFA
ncbi:LuxR C-terminal-related transcriptional regulator [Variovorax sp. GT1P44]|uniref:LuxR C-terminal-related transcriptional regulator n=1 Tax=Variovorax sp. GT1P44 TaxID=3443742 RepID=UPI003F446794